MPAEQVLSLLQAELRGRPLEDIFEWINLQTPLGSASIAQVGSRYRVHLVGEQVAQQFTEWRRARVEKE